MPLLPLTAADVAGATRGRLVSGDAATPIGRISIDSRALAAGEFFVAIRGDRHDGHAFAAEALERGAAGVLISDAASVPSSTSAVVVHVPDTTAGLQDIARFVRRASGARVVAITGSAGKTTTKEICADLLSARYRVFRNAGNLNNHIGLPLSLLELRTAPDVAVVELGMNHAGEIRTLVGIAEPDVRVWTNVGDAHIGFFTSADAIADAKAEILESARPDDVLVANANDPRVMSRASRFTGRLVTFGINTDADVEARDVDLRGLEGTRATVRTPAGEFMLQSPLLGLGNLLNVLAAAAVAVTFEIPLDAIVERAASLRPAHHRGELLRLPGGVTLVDDSYNSSPAALKRSLETLASANGSARKAAVLGEMLELGEHATRLHTECGRSAAAAGLDLLIAVGNDHARELAAGAVAAGMSPASVIHVAQKEQAAESALQRVRPGDLVLVKGSRGIGLDLVVDRLKAEFA
ncbi:MAG TPA: UDP-N-acetylmuramoyl-tripeptide--D-alanyl-D-alanine ligase [Vicinamibacterales bacterium]|nr:UDP-N-acetylmuramoyl-tripeptide--D-alanyl-D-alanine ligase [Vicinamibacterales bacterium]